MCIRRRNARAEITRVQEGAPRFVDEGRAAGVSRAEMREARKVFYGYAGDDGRLDLSELTTCARKLGIYGVNEEKIKDVFQKLDLNSNNSTIDFGEFLSIWNEF